MTPQLVFDTLSWSKTYLDKLRVADLSAHIAGGLLRDLDNGRASKDVDIFLSAPLLHVLTAMEGMESVHVIEAHYFDHDPGPILESRTYKHPDDEGLPINVIRLREPLTMEQNVERFDFGICRIAWDGVNSIVASSEYEADKRDEKFTLRRCENHLQFVRSVRDRYSRLKEKYEGWELVVPAEFEQFRKEPELSDVFDEVLF